MVDLQAEIQHYQEEDVGILVVVVEVLYVLGVGADHQEGHDVDVLGPGVLEIDVHSGPHFQVGLLMTDKVAAHVERQLHCVQPLAHSF